MADILDETSTGPGSPNTHEYTVSGFAFALKATVEETYGRVRIRGEISGFTRAASGHLYMSLKDEKAVLDAVCWRGVASGLRVQPQDGLEVVVTGKVSTYPARSRYQIIVDAMEPAGVGALMALLEARRVKLAGEGLFDDARKQPLPFIPGIIGIVTSPTGAVIRDILHRLQDRFPRHVLVWPVAVQGERAATQIAQAIDGFNALPIGGAAPRPDLLIVARGGGSLEDLWAFNEEIVVRAAAASAIPLISAVGHETDTTLIDYASDFRAPTPSAAAERAVPVRADLAFTVADYERRLQHALVRFLSHARERVEGLARALPRPQDMLGLARQRLDELSLRLPRALETLAAQKSRHLATAGAGLRPVLLRERIGGYRRVIKQNAERLGQLVDQEFRQKSRDLDHQAQMLASLGYHRVLARGYGLVRGPDQALITTAERRTPGEPLEIEMHDGTIPVNVRAPGKAGRDTSRARRPVKRSAGQQGNLFAAGDDA